jgi:hypothetical protein
MGSWPFVFGFLAIMVLWAVVNSVFDLGGSEERHGFDPYPYIATAPPPCGIRLDPSTFDTARITYGHRGVGARSAAMQSPTPA